MVRKAKESYGYSFGELSVASKGKNIFLETTTRILNWNLFDNIFIEHEKESNFGASSYSKLLMFKIMLLQTWYNLSDPQVEEEINDKISFIRFLGISVDSQTPDHSTISRFRKFILKEKLHEKLFNEVNRQLEENNFLVKTGAIVDASVVQSSRRSPSKVIEGVEDRKEDTILLETEEIVEVAEIVEDIVEIEEVKEAKKIEEIDKTEETERTEEKNGKEEIKLDYKETQVTGDADAGWIKKGKKGWVHAYKIHTIVNESGFYLGGHATSGNESDMNQLGRVIKESNLLKGTIVMADKGYTSKKNRELLLSLGLVDGIMNKAVRGRSLTEEEKEKNREISKKRYIVEQSFGLMKQHFKFTRMRYLGLEKCGMENTIKMMSHNIKKASHMILKIMKEGKLEKKFPALC